MESPLPYDDQNDETKSQFDLILSAIYSIDWNSEIEALIERIESEVTAKPILARIMKCNASLISVACTNLDDEHFYPAIKFLILANPQALLWQSSTGKRIINKVANHPSYCVLMPWIAANYQWVLDHERCHEYPPVLCLLRRYAERDETSCCTAAIIRQFFEIYPRGLTQQGVMGTGFTPLHAIVFGSAECEPALFKWLAEQCPSNMLKTDREGETPLHRTCNSLISHQARHQGNDSSEICKYLIAKCPESVQILDNLRWLPIHDLLDHCQHRPVKEVVVCLLQVYPESYDVEAETGYESDDLTPSSIPFIQRIKPLLDEEMELKENIAYLRDVAGLFQVAVDGAENSSPLASSTCDAFGNWATVTFVKRLEARMEQISMQLQDECNAD